MSAPRILFAPGAGKPSSSPWMVRWAERLATLGEVVPFDHPYQEAGRSRPDRMPALVAHARARAEAAQAAHPDRPLVFAGKSMGARVGCHLSLQLELQALICFGYPLAGGGDRNKLRDQVLVDLTTPILLVQGTRDRLAPLDLVEDVQRRMRASVESHVVPTGDHSLLVTKTHTKTTGRSQSDEDDEALAAIRAFLARTLSP